MRVRVIAVGLASAGVLAGCAVMPAPQSIPPNPFGYLKRSAVCTLASPQPIPGGHSVAIATRSDGGLCGVTISRPEGGAYASFLLATLPEHGDSFIYNYNGQTVVTYTASTAYAGPDSFTVSLVAGPGQLRSTLRIDVLADATGVPVPPPPAPPAKPKPKIRHRHHSHPATS